MSLAADIPTSPGLDVCPRQHFCRLTLMNQFALVRFKKSRAIDSYDHVLHQLLLMPKLSIGSPQVSASQKRGLAFAVGTGRCQVALMD